MGQADVDKLARSITAKQLRGWEHYFDLEPPPEMRADFYLAQIAQTVFNMAVEGKHRKPLKDFLIKFDDLEEPKPKQSWQEQARILTMLAMINNAQPEKPEGPHGR